MKKHNRLFLICEGGYHTLYYLVRHGLTPDRVYFDPLAIKMYIPYIEKEDEVLIVLNGLTDFTLKEVHELMKSLHELFGEQTNNIKLFSPFRLNGLYYSYYIYNNDLIYSNIKGVVGGKVIPLIEDITKNNKNEQNNRTKGVKNIVLEPYLTFESVEVNTDDIVIVEMPLPEVEVKRKDNYVDIIRRVNMYN